MHTFPFVLSLAACSIATQAMVLDTLSLQAPIQKINLWFVGAEVQRNASFFLNQGQSTLKITNLPADLGIEDFRFKESVGFQILHAQWQLFSGNTRANNPKLKAIQVQEKEAQEKINQLNQEIQALQNAQHFLEKSGNHPMGSLKPSPRPGQYFLSGRLPGPKLARPKENNRYP